MEPLLVGCLGVLALAVLLIAGVHIGIALGVVGLLGLTLLIGGKAALSAVASGSFHFITSIEFIVFPLFTLMGLVAMYGGISEATFDALSRVLGRLPGGLGIATVVGCAAFGTVCGSSVVTATVFAKVGCPEMRRHGYDKRLAYGIVSSAGMIGMLIPPSTLAVVYGLITGESIGALLIAGIGPGLLMALLFTAGIIVMVRIRPGLAPPVSVRFTLRQRVVGLTKLWPMGLTALVIIGGIYGGVATVTESAAWGALVIIIISVLWGKMRWKQLWNALGESVAIMGMVFLLMSGAKVFSRFLTVSGVGQYLVNAIVGAEPAIWQLLVGMVVVYLILGCFLDSISMLLITIPVIYPILKTIGIEPMWFAMVCIVAIETGLMTPPVGFNVYGVKSVAEPDVTLENIFAGVLPFVIMTVVGVGLLIVFPAIANWLPSHIVA